MQEADVVEVIDVVEDEGGVEGDAGHQLLQQLSVPPKSPVPGASSSSRWRGGEDYEETEVCQCSMISWLWNDPAKNNVESCKTGFFVQIVANFALPHQQLPTTQTIGNQFICGLCQSDQTRKSVLMVHFLVEGVFNVYCMPRCREYLKCG